MMSSRALIIVRISRSQQRINGDQSLYQSLYLGSIVETSFLNLTTTLRPHRVAFSYGSPVCIAGLFANRITQIFSVDVHRKPRLLFF